MTVTLEPRSACGFTLYEYAAYLNITVEWPMTLYYKENMAVKYTEVDNMVISGRQPGTENTVNCLTSSCNLYYYTYYRWKYFLLVNWDFEQPASV